MESMTENAKMTQDEYMDAMKSGECLDKLLGMHIEKDKPLFTQVGLPLREVQELYMHAANLYNHGQYKKAADILQILVLIDQSTPLYAEALAMCHKHMGAWLEASSLYQYLILNGQNRFYTNAIECAFMGNNTLLGSILMLGLNEVEGVSQELKEQTRKIFGPLCCPVPEEVHAEMAMIRKDD